MFSIQRCGNTHVFMFALTSLTTAVSLKPFIMSNTAVCCTVGKSKRYIQVLRKQRFPM